MTEEELIQKAKTLIRRYDNMRITGSRGEWSGNARLGFMFNPQGGGGSAGGGGGGGGGITGACCLRDGSCIIATSVSCTLALGTYLGDGSTCTPNPCSASPTGACCVGTDCSIETSSDCGDMGGVYQGDDTTCDPNPCTLPACCPNAFAAFDGSDRRFLSKTVDYTITRHVTGPSCGGVTGDGTITIHDQYDIDPDTCIQTCVASGGGTFTLIVNSTGVHRIDCVVTRTTCGTTHSDRTDYDCFGVQTSHSVNDVLDTVIGCGYYPNNTCINPSGPLSETTTDITCHIEIDDGAGTVATFNAVLSNECIP